MPFRIPRPLFRWAAPSFLTPTQAQAYVFMLRLVEGSVFLFGGDSVLLHAACVERHGRTVALTSSGGVGKTSTAALLLGRPGWRYLTDDMAIPNAEGDVGFYPRWPMVYDYNLRHDPGLRRRIVRAAGWRGRLHWSLLAAARIERRRRRVDPAVLWGEERIGRRGSLDTVVFLTRGGGERLRVEEATAGDLARRSRSIIAIEERVLGEVIQLWEAAGDPPVRWEQALDRHQQVYEKTFAVARRRLHLELPRSGSVAEAAAHIEEIVGGEPGS